MQRGASWQLSDSRPMGLLLKLPDAGRTHDDDIDAEDHYFAAEALRHAFKAMLGSSVRAQKGRPDFAGH